MAARFVTGAKVVTAAGTAEALVAASTLVSQVIIQAKIGNTGNIFVGDSGVSATNGQTLGAPASATTTPDAITIGPEGGHDWLDLLEVFVDAGVNGEGVNFLYMI
jgi:hypothetical protein